MLPGEIGSMRCRERSGAIAFRLGDRNDYVQIDLRSGEAHAGGVAGNDLLVGGGSRDTLSGGPGRDRLMGSAGNDVLYGDAGRDDVKCGSGRDTAYVQREDRVARFGAQRCERVQGRTLTKGGDQGVVTKRMGLKWPPSRG